jgi:hypothetical protein
MIVREDAGGGDGVGRFPGAPPGLYFRSKSVGPGMTGQFSKERIKTRELS